MSLRAFLRTCALAILPLAAFGLTAGPGNAAQGPVVHCHDLDRGIVQQTLRGDCAGEVVSEAEARRIREKARSRRASGIDLPDRSGVRDPDRTLRGIGSGFVVAAGYVFTANHVVDGCTRVRVRRHDGAERGAAIALAYPDEDVALLHAPRLDGVTPMPVASGGSPVGESVRVIGFPTRGLPRLQPTVASATVKGVHPGPTGLSTLVLEARLHFGQSGAAVVDGRGQVVGLAVAKLNRPAVFQQSGEMPGDLGFAVPASRLRAILAEQEVEAEDAGAMSMDTDTLERRAVRVTCHSEWRGAE